MITYEVALDKAKRANPKIDMYAEYPEAFVFTNSKAKGYDREDNEVVVERKKGNFITYTELIMSVNRILDGVYKAII